MTKKTLLDEKKKKNKKNKKKKKRRDKEKEAHPTGNELTVSYATGHIVTDAPGDIL